MNITFTNGSNWTIGSLTFEFDPHSDDILVVHDLSREVIEKIRGKLDNMNVVVLNSSTRILPNTVYLVHADKSYSFDGKSLTIDSGTSAAELADLILRSYPEGSITLLSEDFTVLHSSGEAYSDHQMDPKSMSGINLKDVLEIDIYNKFIQAVSECSKGVSAEYESEFDGRYYLTIVNQIQESGTVYYMLRAHDVTEKHEIETALLESERRARYFVDQSQEIVCTHDHKGNYKLVSPSVKRLMGYAPEEMIGKHPYDFIHPDDHHILKEQSHEKLLAQERPENIQYRARKKDGSYVWMDSYADFITDANSKVTSLLTVSRDVTDLKHIEIELRKSEARFRGLADNLPGVIYLCNNDSSYSMMYLNDEVEYLTGYHKEDFLSGIISFIDLYHPDDADNVISTVDKALTSEQSFRVTYRLRNIRRGDWVWVEEYGQGIYDDNKLVSIEGVLLDITQKVKDQQRLEQSEANLKAIFESTESIVALFDNKKNLIEYNTSFKNYVLAGENFELKAGPSFWEYIDPEKAKEFKSYQDRALKGEKFTVTSNYVTPYGELNFLINYNPIYTKSRITGVSVFIQDITELTESQRKLEKYAQGLETLVKERTSELEEKNHELIKGNEQLEAALLELQAAQSQLIQSEKMASLGVLSSGIAHEINNPLNFVKNGSIALFEHVKVLEGYDPKFFEPYFELIGDGVARVANIIKSLSHFSRQVKSMDEKCNLTEIIENCLVILQNKTKDKVIIRKSFDHSCSVLGNEGKLHQAFLNILANAEQSIGENGHIHIAILREGNMAVVEITDDGEGISKENLDKIGDPFFTTKPPGVGTGLGLFITYSIIDEHDGKIEVNSIVKKGTKIRIELPNL